MLFLDPKPKRSSLSQEVGDVERPGPSPWKPLSHCFHSSTSLKTIQEAWGKQILPNQCPVSGRCGWGIPMGMENKAAREQSSSVLARILAGTRTTQGERLEREMNENMGRVKGTNRW